MLTTKYQMFFFAPDGNESGKNDSEDKHENPELDNTKKEDVESFEYNADSDSDEKYEEIQKSLLDEMNSENKEPDDSKESTDEKSEKPENTEQSDAKESGNTEAKQESSDVIINADYINTRPENEQQILKDLLGKRTEITSDPQMLKNYVNAQVLIAGQKKQVTDYQENINDHTFQQNDNRASKSGQKITSDRVNKEVLKATTDYLTTKYSDFPEDALTNEESLSEYSEMLSPAKSYALMRDIEHAKDHYQKEVTNYAQKYNNWEAEAVRVIDNALGAYDNVIKEAYGKSASDYEPNLKDYDWLIQNVIIPNSKTVVSYLDSGNNIPVLNENALIAALSQNTSLLKHISNKSIAEARAEGYQKRTDAEPPPSLAGSNIPAKQNKDALPTNIGEETSLEAGEEILERAIEAMR